MKNSSDCMEKYLKILIITQICIFRTSEYKYKTESFNFHIVSFTMDLSECYLMLSQQFFSRKKLHFHEMMMTVCTRLTRLVGFLQCQLIETTIHG